MAPVSAETGEGLEDLLNLILLDAEMQDLQANFSGAAKGVVVESELSKQKGAIATLLVKSGNIKTGQLIVSGTSYGKVRAHQRFRDIKEEAGTPATPVEILDFIYASTPGELFRV